MSESLIEFSDADILLAYDNGLADFHLAEKYDHNAHLRAPIRNWLDRLRTELENRGIEYSHAKVRQPTGDR